MEKLLSHEKLKKLALSDPEVKAEYERLEEEFALLHEELKAKRAANLTQAQIATHGNETGLRRTS